MPKIVQTGVGGTIIPAFYSNNRGEGVGGALSSGSEYGQVGVYPCRQSFTTHMKVFTAGINICLFCGLGETYAYVMLQKIVWVCIYVQIVFFYTQLLGFVCNFSKKTLLRFFT